MAVLPMTHVIQVTNVAPAATLDQMKELFGHLGKIHDIKLYPSDNYIIEPQSKVCYVKYYETWSVGVAQHLTNTVFIDRALIIVPISENAGIPSEATALSLTNPTSALPGLVTSGPNALINEITSVDGKLLITTLDPKLAALGLPQYPPLPANMDPAKIEEIRRTVYVGNLDSNVSAEQLLKFVSQIGEVKYVRMAGDETQSSRFAFVEFSEQASVATALQYNGVLFENRPLRINHSNNAIVKPQPKSSEAAQKEIDEAMKRVKEAQSLITAAIEPELADSEKKHSRHSRSRSRSRKRSRSRSRHSKRSRSKRSSSRHRSSSKTSSRSRRRSKTPPSRSKRDKTRSRSRDKIKKESTSRRHRTKSRSRSKEHSSKRSHRSRSRSAHRSHSKSKSEKISKKKETSKSDREKDDRKKDDRKMKEKSAKESKAPKKDEASSTSLEKSGSRVFSSQEPIESKLSEPLTLNDDVIKSTNVGKITQSTSENNNFKYTESNLFSVVENNAFNRQEADANGESVAHLLTSVESNDSLHDLFKRNKEMGDRIPFLEPEVEVNTSENSNNIFSENAPFLIPEGLKNCNDKIPEKGAFENFFRTKDEKESAQNTMEESMDGNLIANLKTEKSVENTLTDDSIDNFKDTCQIDPDRKFVKMPVSELQVHLDNGANKNFSKDEKAEGSSLSVRSSKDDHAGSENESSNSPEKRSRQSRSGSKESPSIQPKRKSRSNSKQRKSKSPVESYRSNSREKNRSRSPSIRHSTKKRSLERDRSSRNRSRTPKQSKTVHKRSRTPRKRSITPRKRSITPRKRSRTPRKRSRTPHKRSRTPRKRSRTPRKRSRTPRKRSRTPPRRSRTPRGRSRTPRKRSRTPVKRSRTPRKRSRSPRRSRSPSKRNRIHKRSVTPKRLSRSPSYGKYHSRRRSGTPTLVRSSKLSRSSRSPRSSSLSPSDSRSQKRKSRVKESSVSLTNADTESKDSKVIRNYDEEEKGYENPEKISELVKNVENIENIVGRNDVNVYCSREMDIASV